MPFKSEAQRRLFYLLERKGKLKKGTTRHWNEETGDRKLPEKVGAFDAMDADPKLPNGEPLQYTPGQMAVGVGVPLAAGAALMAGPAVAAGAATLARNARHLPALVGGRVEVPVRAALMRNALPIAAAAETVANAPEGLGDALMGTADDAFRALRRRIGGNSNAPAAPPAPAPAPAPAPPAPAPAPPAPAPAPPAPAAPAPPAPAAPAPPAPAMAQTPRRPAARAPVKPEEPVITSRFGSLTKSQLPSGTGGFQLTVNRGPPAPDANSALAATPAPVPPRGMLR